MAERKVIPDGAVIACLDCDWSSADMNARHECPNDPKRLQAKLELAEMERDEANGALSETLGMLADAHAMMLIPICVHCGTKPGAAAKATHWRECPNHPAHAALAAAESALAAAQGALRRVLEKVQSLIAEFGDRPSAALDIVNAYADETLHHAALAGEPGKPGGEARALVSERLHREAALAKLLFVEAPPEAATGPDPDYFATSAESALAAAQGAWKALRANILVSDGADKVMRGVWFRGGDAVAQVHAVDAALAAESGNPEPRAAPPALPAELSGKGEQRALEALERAKDRLLDSIEHGSGTNDYWRSLLQCHLAEVERDLVLVAKAYMSAQSPDHAREPGEAKKEEGA